MVRDNLKKRLEGCYVTVPTLFDDRDLELDLEATRSHVRYLIERGDFTEEQILTLEDEIDGQMAEAIEFAKSSPAPSVEAFLEEVAPK